MGFTWKAVVAIARREPGVYGYEIYKARILAAASAKHPESIFCEQPRESGIFDAM